MVITTDLDLTARQKVQRLEEGIQQLPQVHCPIHHYFAGGIYAREITIPAGVCLTGAVHRHEHLCTISQGRIRVTTDEGVQELSAPFTLVSKPGAKRAGYALDTTVWTTYHQTDQRDLEKIMGEITESETSELLGGADNVQWHNNLLMQDREDYAKFLAEYGIDDGQVQEIFGAMVYPEHGATIVGASSIHKMGTFAEDEVPVQNRIGLVQHGILRFMNHSCRANAVLIPEENGCMALYPLKPISSGEEITIDYRHIMSVQQVGFQPIERVTE